MLERYGVGIVVVSWEVTEPVKVTSNFRYIDDVVGWIDSKLRRVSSFDGLWIVGIEIEKEEEEGDDGEGFAIAWMMMHGVMFLDIEVAWRETFCYKYIKIYILV